MNFVTMIIGVMAFCTAIFCFFTAGTLTPENIMQQIYQICYGIAGWVCMMVFMLAVIFDKISSMRFTFVQPASQPIETAAKIHIIDEAA